MGSPSEAERVYRELAPSVLGYLRAQRVPEPQQVLGEIFLQVVRDLHRVSGDDVAVRKWVFTIARHRVIDDARRRAREPRLSDRPVPEIAGGVVEPIDPGLIDALSHLTAGQREVLILRFVADLSIEMVAKMTHRRAGAVRSLQHRGLAQLAEALSQAPSRHTVESCQRPVNRSAAPPAD